MRGICSPEQRAQCPILKEGCYTDTHHLEFGHDKVALRGISRIYSRWREDPNNKTNQPRCWHKALHASGYQPPLISKEEMLSEIWSDEPTQRQLEELNRQLLIGKIMMGACGLPPDEAA